MRNKTFVMTFVVGVLILYLIAGPETAGAGAVVGAMGARVQVRRKRQAEREQRVRQQEKEATRERETLRDQAKVSAEREAETRLNSDF